MTTLLAVLVLVGAPLVGAYVWFRIANSKNGERYLKQRMQGPYVPVDDDSK